jgi:hypothetical protein
VWSEIKGAEVKRSKVKQREKGGARRGGLKYMKWLALQAKKARRAEAMNSRRLLFFFATNKNTERKTYAVK